MEIFENIAQNIFRTFKANYQNFALQFVWGKNIESEWRKFTDANKFDLWRENYRQQTKEDELANELEQLVNTFTETIKSAMPTA